MTIALPLIGHGDAEAAFLAANESGKLHHAWLIEGPAGIGKSRLAMRLAAYMLGARGPGDTPLDAQPADPVMQAYLAGGHPDQRTVQIELNDKGKPRQDITVDQIRDLNHFFTLRPAMGGWRVGIIDALDELNRNGANALLKTLEEPPASSIMFLINHGSKPILPTIRSRCRILRLKRLTDEDTADVLKLVEAPKESLGLARGRPGLGIRLSSPAGLQAANAARAMLRGMPKPNDALLTAALQTANADAVAMEAFSAEVLGWLADKAEDNPAAADAWLRTSRLLGEADELNMEASQTAAKVIAGLYSVVGQG
ncbi:MAG: DNA polymerase III subunit delta' [Alphaproteobacteria bacterium]|nr:DNA polymerase III subunit delta' [Alphaproteobacteria bacterium]MBU2083098.1 DNA polymerase III subunit delta' [Alphaproteobacteria bacterium]MBU2144603.1 DNA polymerase III subunit delta' [Alphaproteobacteria bacterium]MBU2195382.1 DNA polymerase III subunit delta' [Alphaproteobacteria bacterium]